MKKTLLFNILTAAVMLLTAYSPLASDNLAAWMGVVAAAITLLLNTLYISGTWVASGWSWMQWAVVIGNILLNAGGMINEQALVPPHIVNYITIGATFLIQFFGKNYKQE